MKKFNLVILLSLFLSFSNVSVTNATSSVDDVYLSINDLGVLDSFTILSVDDDEVMVSSPNGNYITYSRTYTFENYILPPSSISATEVRGGITYAGVLTLQSYLYSNNKTYATYKGSLYPIM